MGLFFSFWVLSFREIVGLFFGEFLSEFVIVVDRVFCFMVWSIVISFFLFVRKVV